jgi:uncharacterized protein involved in type VI secretion and phage assembly
VPEERRLAQMVITVGGTRLPAERYELVSLARVEESVHLPDSFVLRLADPHFELFDRMAFPMGSAVEIGFAAEGDPTVVTRGEVTALAVEQGAGGLHELVVSGMDVGHRLSRGPKTRSFQQMTDADIVNRIAADYGFEVDADATSEVHEYVLQSSQSDYAFLKQRGDRIGFDLWVAEGKLHFKRRPQAAASPPILTWGENLHKFKVRFSSVERCDEVVVRAWDPASKAAIVGRATQGDLGSDAPGARQVSDASHSAFGEVRRFAGQFPMSTQAEADALAQSLLLKASGEEVVVRGEAAGNPLIAAGAEVEIRAVGQKLSGRYRITSAEHVYGSSTPYVTRFVCGGKGPGGLVDLVGGAERRGWGSLVVGVVTNCDDPLSLGRVKVKFPSLTDDDESGWARVVSPGGGASRGLQCVPEVNDEVLVGFEHDDKRRPLVLGGLHNGKDAPPVQAVEGGKVVTRTWKSRSGHVVQLSDKDGDGTITVALGDARSSLSLKKDTSTLEAADTLVVRANKIQIQATGDLELKGASVKVEASGQVKIQGSRVEIN